MPPSQRLGTSVSPDLEALIMRCLSKAPSERPPGAEALEQALAQCRAAGTWTAADAEEWWKTNLAGIDIAQPASMAEKTLVIAPRP